MAKIDQEILGWLTSCPAGDLNFRHRLKEADEPTIMAAIEALEGKPDNKTAVKELRAQLQKLRAMALETYDHHTAVLKMADVTFQAEREADQQRLADQAVREGMIAKCFEVIGQIKGVQMLTKFGDVASLVWLKQVKETKIYRDVPGIGTWDKFCESIGKSRRHIDEDLLNLQVFGEEFLGYVSGLGVGYRELKQLRQLTHDGAVVINGDQLCIPDESPIPIDQDHAEELQAAIERMIAANNETKKRLTRLEKDFKGAVKEETLSFHTKEDTYIKRIQELVKYEPESMDDSRFEEQYQTIHDAINTLACQIGTLVMIKDLHENPLVAAKVEGHIASAERLVEDLRRDWTAKFQIF